MHKHKLLVKNAPNSRSIEENEYYIGLLYFKSSSLNKTKKYEDESLKYKPF